MAELGESVGVAPRACPFIALELDRDRRSDRPDYGHRCYAEPTPQPRAIAHQEAYCLSPNFAACPIFQDWAQRAAARPVQAAEGDAARATTAAGAVAGMGLAAARGVEQVAPTEAEPEAGTVAPDTPVIPAPDEAWPADAFPPDEEDVPEQLEVFEPRSAAEESTSQPGEEPVGRARLPVSDWAAAGRPPVEMPVAPVAGYETAADAEPPPGAGRGEAPLPGFLAGRETARPRSSRPDAVFSEKVKREDLIPSWEIDGRYGAQASDDGRRDRFGGLVTAIAVIAILALGVAGVIFLPGLLAGGGPAKTATPIPTTLPSGLPSGLPTVLPTLVPSSSPIVTIAPTASATASAGPVATPRVYVVKAGDTLRRIARRFDVTVDEILAANPQITNPDIIVPGQQIVIPTPLPTAAP